MLSRLGDATPAELHTRASGHNDVDQVDPTQLVEHPTGLVAKAGCFHHLRQCFPEHVGKEADENVSEDAVFTLMPDRSNPQIALVDPERDLGLGELPYCGYFGSSVCSETGDAADCPA